MWEANIAMQNAFYDEKEDFILHYREDMNKCLDIYFQQLQKNAVETFEAGDIDGAAEIVENMFHTAPEEKFSTSDVIYWSEHILRQFIGIIRDKDEKLSERYTIELPALIKGSKSIPEAEEILRRFLEECRSAFEQENVDYNTRYRRSCALLTSTIWRT